MQPGSRTKYNKETAMDSSNYYLVMLYHSMSLSTSIKDNSPRPLTRHIHLSCLSFIYQKRI